MSVLQQFNNMRITKGVSLGPYQILSRIGAGGMGEVWRARDARIGRDVAVKVLPDVFDEESVKRFEQEARAAGSLSHPGLVTIFDVGTTGEWPYIVMEMLEGETLRDALGDGDPATPLPPRKAVDYAAQVATALAVAHEQGIIHRDLKPENLFITSDRRVKILDFGLAKLASDAQDADGRKRSSAHLTGAGIAVGTPAYMSPEQVRAHRVDPRTDIFSLGAVLYEMLTGKPPFQRFSAIETMHSVLNSEPPPLEEVVPEVSPALAALVHHCLEKDPRDRFRSAQDLAFQLRNLPEMLQTSGSGMRASPRTGKSRPSRTWMLVAPIVLAAAAGGFAVRALRLPEPPAVERVYKQLTFAEGLETDPTIAPDGKSFAYALAHTGNRDIYIQRVDGRAAINITADSPDDESEPAFSPDGSKIAFRSERDGGGIFVMGVTGELVRRLTKGGHDPSWSPDGTRIVFSTVGVPFGPQFHRSDGNLRIVDTRDGTSRLLVDYHAPGVETDALQPTWSPHGKRIAFRGVSRTDSRWHIWTIDPDAQQPMKTLVRATSDNALHWNPVWSPDGRFLYFGSDRDGTLNLWRIAIDETTGKPESEKPEPISLPASFSGSFSMSQRGELLFNTLNRSYRLLGLPFDAGSGRTGEPRVLFGGAEEILTFEPSPDGQAVAYTTGGAQEDLFVVNIDGTRLRQLTNDPARDRGVTWSADGKTLYFYSDRKETYQIWRIQADGSDLAAVTDSADLKRVGASSIYTPIASPDGRMLVAQTNRESVFVHLGGRSGQRLERIPAPVALSRWSPDGTRLVGVDSRRQMVIYSPGARRLEHFAVPGSNRQWLPDGRHVATFGRPASALSISPRTV
ncbi:MAG TPA: protein kinase [Thermoanaerobaculia bacterium]